ncbi:MAG: NADH-quinone oxidoreductase subunit I [Planctomycetes bacterium]|nr:NADH-quinone oxidoreductase subunit I [Planctomycetota bacterium]
MSPESAPVLPPPAAGAASAASAASGAPRFAAAVANPKVMRHALTTNEKLFVGPFLKSLLYTFSRMFKKDITRRYPEQKMENKPSLHGVPVLVMKEDGAPRCVACGLCEFVCPPRAIDIQPGETDRPIEREPKSFVIDMLRCIECSYCEEVCPEEAIVMSTDYEVVGRRREDFVWDLKKLLKPIAQLKDRIAWVRRTYRRWDSNADASAPPEGGVYRDPRWAGKSKPVDHH